MSSRPIPYFDFYPADFMHGVRGLSAQEVGVYTMVLCRIYEENGPIEFNTMRLSTYCGMRESTFVKTLEKLICLDKFQLENGKLSNRRAMTEISNRANKLKINSKAGKVSAEKRQQKQQYNQTDVQRAFNHTDTDTDNSYTASARAQDVTERMPELYSALGVTDETKLPGLLTYSEPIQWVNAGCDVDADILPALRSIAARGRPVKSWAYCSSAVFEARDRRIAPAPQPQAAPRANSPPRQRTVSDVLDEIANGTFDPSRQKNHEHADFNTIDATFTRISV